MVDIPNNSMGYQNTYSGNGYASLAFYHILQFPNDSNFRNYLEVKLIDTLQARKKYCFEMYLSLSDSSNYSVLNIGVLFSIDSITDTSFYKPLPYLPQITNTSSIIYGDTMNWMLFQSNYIAQGGEQFITIGNFDYDSTTILIPAQGTGFYGEDLCYYYIDNISVSLCDTVRINESQFSDFRFQISPNPNDGNMRMDYEMKEGQKGELIIYDMTGRIVRQYILNSERNNLQIELMVGIYFYNVSINGENVLSDKLVIIK